MRKAQLPLVGRRSLTTLWGSVTVVSWVIAFLVVRPGNCSQSDGCQVAHEEVWRTLNSYAACALLTAFLLEVASLQLTYTSTKPLLGIISGIENTFIPSGLLSVTFLVLILENLLVTRVFLAHVAAPGVGAQTDRPVYTVVYLEWCINVPILLLLVAKCALGRPLDEVVRPLVVTNLYIILSWAAFFFEGAMVRWSMVFVAFVMYAWASWDMIVWTQNFRKKLVRKDMAGAGIRVSLVTLLIVSFGVYGAVYIAAFRGDIRSSQEMASYIMMNIGVKITLLISFIGLRARQFYDLVINLLVNVDMPLQRQIAVVDGEMGAEFDSEVEEPLLA